MLAAIPGSGHAAGTETASEPDDARLGDLLSLLDNETELATRSGMNADFVPGMATILSGGDMLVRGARTVWEALSLVPGISQGLAMTGERQILSRGVGFGYASGNIKLLLDGVSMNSTLLATANPVLNIPIEQVDRASWNWFNLPFEVPETWLDTALGRRILSAILQDEIRASERVTVTAALRLDDFSDLGAFLTPRLAAVWRIDDSNILKLQYARAFRRPTFYEQAYPGRDSIGAGEIATYELGYILKPPRWEGRLILFRFDLTDPIVFGEDDDGFTNNADARLRGVELEYRIRIGTRVKIDANLSYVDAVSRGPTLRCPAARTSQVTWRCSGTRSNPGPRRSSCATSAIEAVPNSTPVRRSRATPRWI